MSVFLETDIYPIAIPHGHKKIRLLFKPEGSLVSERTLGQLWRRSNKKAAFF